MSNGLAGLFPALVYLGIVVASPAVAVAAWLLGRRSETFGEALATVGGAAIGAVLAGGTALALFVDPLAGVTFVAVAAAGAVVLAVFPLFIGRRLLERWTPLPPDAALEHVTLGWPVALVASFLVFVAPGGVGRYNASFLGGAAAILVWTFLVVLVTFGPALAGLGWYRLRERRAGS